MRCLWQSLRLYRLLVPLALLLLLAAAVTTAACACGPVRRAPASPQRGPALWVGAVLACLPPPPTPTPSGSPSSSPAASPTALFSPMAG